MIQYIPNHAEQAVSRLLEQFKGLEKFPKMVQAMGERIQAIEDVCQDFLNKRSILDAEGKNLDVWGEILAEQRNGLSDEEYRILLLGKVATNVSQGTPEDVMAVLKILTQSDYVQYQDLFPAGMILTTVGSIPVTSIENIKKSVRRAAPAGVSIDIFSTVPGNAFSFFSDPDPNGRGFDDLNNPGNGGVLATFF